MKRTQKITVLIQQSQKGSNNSLNCSCQILLDTSLSNIGDSDCQCSDCLQANLNAFNQWKDQEDAQTYHTNRHQPKQYRSKNTLSVKKAIKSQQQHPFRNHSSTDRLVSKTKNKIKYGISSQLQKIQNNFDQINPLIKNQQFTDNQLNDFLLITKNRTRKYLNQRKQLKGNQMIKKNLLKDKIKKNLQLLKYTAQLIRDNNQDKSHKHPYKWNHSIYTCQCNGKLQEGVPNHNCCRRIKIKQSLNTNLQKFQPQFPQNRAQILQQRKKKRQQQRITKQQQLCPYDECPNHHNRTKKQKIKKIQKKIQQNIKKYNRQKKKNKQQQQEKQKIKQGKLRAIDLKSKQILTHTKKYDDNISKTSFKLSIDNFDTFSQIKQYNNRKKQKNNPNILNIPQHRNNAIYNKQLQNKIYQDIDEQFNQQIVNHPQQNIIIKRTIKANAPQYRFNQQQIYQRIAYDAQIKPPKDLKPQPKQTVPKLPKSQVNKKTKQQIKNLNKIKEQKKKKLLQQQIQKKKKQIFQQYQKRNSNKAKNKQLRKQYQQKIKQQPKNTKSLKNPTYQVRVYDDPFLQQFQYRQQQSSKPRGQNMQIFTENVQSLKSKTKLKV